MKRELRLIKLPVIVGKEINEVDPYEVTVAALLLSNKFGTVSKTNRYLLEDEYELPRRFKADLLALIKEVHNKGLVDVINIDEIDKKSKTIKTREVECEQYTLVDFNLIEKILLSGARIDTIVNTIYTLVILQSLAGMREFKGNKGQKGYAYPSINTLAKEVNISRTGILASIELLEELDILEVVRQGSYTTTNSLGQRIVKDYNNLYIIKQITYTEEQIQQLREEAARGLAILNSQAFDKKVKSHAITDLTGDDYNQYREEERDELDHEIHNFIESQYWDN